MGHAKRPDALAWASAVAPGPMIATIVDGTGLMIYFLIAHLTLPQLAGL